MSARLMVVCAAAVLCVCWGASTPAEAQIYMLRQADGTIVLSDKPLGPGARTFAVERTAPNVRTTRPTGGSMSSRVSSYDDLIEEHAAKQNLRPDLVRAVIQVESGGNPRAFSNKGAMGLMQLMPATAREMGVRNPYDPTQNIRGGTAYLRQLLDKFGGDEALALAAYNAGAGAVTKYGNAIPPYRETRQYVDKISGRASVYTGGSAPIYKWTEVVDGVAVPRYSNTKPKVANYQIVHRRSAIVMPASGDDDNGTR
jgi:soluble lytic murein transglycosylase-like protein